MIDPTPVAGFVLGLAGSAHCVAMCGGVTAALDRVASGSGRQRAGSHVLYAVGRVTSYALFGAVAGTLGLVVTEALGSALMPRVQLATRTGVGLLLIALGLGLAGFRPLRGAERLGVSIWRRLRPLSRHLMRLPVPLRTLGLGALWGFLPCGMVYGAAAVAAVTGSPAQGAAFMVAFGLGTAPAVLATGAVAAGLWRRLGRQNLRRVSALALALCGVWTLLGTGLLGAFAAHH